LNLQQSDSLQQSAIVNNPWQLVNIFPLSPVLIGVKAKAATYKL